MVSLYRYVWPKTTDELSEAELEIEMSSVVGLESDEVLSVSELFEEFKESSVPPLHEMIVRLTKKMIKMTKIFFTFSSKYLFVGKNLIQEIILFTENINIFSLFPQNFVKDRYELV